MYRCLLRNSKTLRRSSASLKYRKYGNFRRYTSISHNFKRRITSSYKKRNINNYIKNTITTPTTASILYSKKYFSSHQPNDTAHSGSIGQYADTLFEAWKNDPHSVDKSWKEYFEKYYGYFSDGTFLKSPSSPTGGDVTSQAALGMITDATNLLKLVRSYQAFGHYMANLDPLGILKQGIDRNQFIPELLQKEHWGFTEKDMDRPIYVGDHTQFLQLMDASSPYVTLRDVETKLKSVYCSSIGYQYMHIANFEKNNFLRKSIERDISDYECSKDEKIRILDRLMWAEEFENFLDLKYPAQKRFGINGGESFVPLLKEIIDEGARLGINDFVIGMPHRGRLIFLATVLRKPLWQIFYEFRGLAVPWEQIGDSGDVKYHLGHSLDRSTPDGLSVHLSLFPNPSHLEAVNPVIMGKTRAKQYYNEDIARSKTCAIIIHGDASFAGQGVVYESMALTDLPKYTTGGVVHVIVNNQIGFTTDAISARSSPYCTDIARSVAAPILHVNGDDPEAVTKCAKLSMRYRQNFKTDAVIDMLCFRRYGHNEGDEPMFTQPLMYKVINNKVKNKDVVIDNYKNKLIKEGTITENEILDIQHKIRTLMNDNYELSANREDIEGELRADWLGANWSDIKGAHEDDINQHSTGISKETALHIANCTSTESFPKNVAVHKTLKKILDKRTNSILHDDNSIDWGTAEIMAYGSLLLEGIHVRISGQDCERGTFSHRHCVVHDQDVSEEELMQNRITYTPLSQGLTDLNTKKAIGDLFSISNSNLSEFGVLGFEYGYSCESPKSLVVWEAQFGDFANGAMVIFDQFVSSAETKWLRQSGLVVLLPHGYEGGGPEHSSGRMERYLQMCSDDEDVYEDDWIKQLTECNWQILNCTSPSNYFHALRRQIHRDFRKPLIVFTPKFGLRHPLATSSLSEFLVDRNTRFKPVIPGQCDNKHPDKVKKLVFCSGKIFLNLEEFRVKNKLDYNDVVITRVEEIAPFPYNVVSKEISKYKNAEIVWVQEEPKNMGAYSYIKPRFDTTLKKLNLQNEKQLNYIGRKPNASPATGYPQVNKKEGQDIINDVFLLQ